MVEGGSLLERKKLIITVLLITLTIIVAALLPLRRYSVISVSEIKIEPEGVDDPSTEEVEGYYWVVAATTDITDEIAFQKILENGTEATIDDKKVVTKSTISIKLTPHRPYWEMPLTWEPVMVYPKTYQASGTAWWFGKDTDVYVSQKTLQVYRFTRGYWEAHTPFTVYVYKNDELIGSKYIDTVGGTETVTIVNPSDPKEKIIITNLGKIGAAYQITLSRLALIGGLTYAYDESVIERILRYDSTSDSFSCYWFGPPEKEDGSAYNRWKDDGSPIGLWITSTLGGDYVEGVVKAPGWEDKTTVLKYVAKPKAASFNDIISYVERFYHRQNVDIWNVGAELVGNKLRVYMPYGAMSSLITIRISSELADTVVWKPPTANIKVMSYPDSLGEIGEEASFMVVFKQESTVRSTGRIDLTIEPQNLPASVIPETLNPTLDPGATLSQYFTLKNLGASERTSGTLVITCRELTTGSITDQVRIGFTLLPRAQNATTLEVYTIDKETGEKVSGIPVVLRYDTKSDLKYTDQGVIIWDLGGYTGTVSVTSGETAIYKSASATKTITPGTINTITLYLEKREAPPPPIPEWIIYVVVACIIAGAIVVSAYLIRRKR